MLIPAIPFLRRIVRPSTTWTSSASLAAASSTSWRSWWTTRRAAKNIPTTRWTNTVSSKLSISCLQNRKGCEKWLLYQLSHCHCPRWLNVTPIFWFPPISFLHFKSREFNYCLQAREREWWHHQWQRKMIKACKSYRCCNQRKEMLGAFLMLKLF